MANALRSIALGLLLAAGALGIYSYTLEPPALLTALQSLVFGDGEGGTHKERLW